MVIQVSSRKVYFLGIISTLSSFEMSLLISRDVPMSSEELRFVIDKLQRMFKELDLQELPPLVYQLLLLSTKVRKWPIDPRFNINGKM